jgi:Domain of unknown function (DUF4386)
MTSWKRVGRLVGVLLLLHLALGLTVPFIMLHPLISLPGFLASAAGVANQTRTAVLIFFVGSALAIAIASAAWRVFREYSSAMALWLFALAVASFALQAVDNSHILSMLSLSQAYAEAGAAKADLFQGLALVVGSARKWSHYSFLLVVGCWILLLFSLLYRFRLVPRVLAALGMIGAVLQIAGVSLRGLLGYPPETRLAMPLAPAYVLLALWLMVKGFDERQRPLSADADGASPGPTQ